MIFWVICGVLGGILLGSLCFDLRNLGFFMLSIDLDCFDWVGTEI